MKNEKNWITSARSYIAEHGVLLVMSGRVSARESTPVYMGKKVFPYMLHCTTKLGKPVQKTAHEFFYTFGLHGSEAVKGAEKNVFRTVVIFVFRNDYDVQKQVHREQLRAKPGWTCLRLRHVQSPK